MQKWKLHRALCGLLVPVALLAASLSCGERDPLKTLARARAAHEIEALSWVMGTPQTDEQGQEHVYGVVSLRVTDTGSPLALDCLTVDVIFSGAEEGGRELGRTPIELDLSGLIDAGGSLELTRRVELPEGTENVGLVLHPAEGEALRGLCEGRAIASGAS
ncbi:MAG TPA: hypothetical protein ENK10_05870 [Acidobacteria bacterium]|nr:hypothetical protein [Acidobacteriota bacterium]